MEPWNSSLWSQKPATGHYSDRLYNTHTHTLEIHFNINLTPNNKILSLKLSLPFRFSDHNFVRVSHLLEAHRTESSLYEEWVTLTYSRGIQPSYMK
jgi:hypothetical protein